jgi:hypothetical protein
VPEAPVEVGPLNRVLHNPWFSSSDIHRLKIDVSNENNQRMEANVYAVCETSR